MESLARIEDLAGEWITSAKTREEVVNLVILEQLLSMLPEKFVRERKPKTSEEASKLADDYIVARKEDAANVKSKGKRNPEMHNRYGGFRGNGQPPRESRSGQGKTDKEKARQENPRNPRRDPKNVECFNCHEKGNYAFQCPN